MSHTWNPGRFFVAHIPLPSPIQNKVDALVILNTPINSAAYEAVSSNADRIICVDGGANQLRRIYKEEDNIISNRAPSVIIGDLDSITPATRSFFAARKVPIVHDPDQNSTDLTKALRWIRDHPRSRHPNAGTPPRADHTEILLFGSLSGRVDQAFSLIHHLIVAEAESEPQAQAQPDPMSPSTRPTTTIYLISPTNISFLLPSGRNTLTSLDNPSIFGREIGLIPLPNSVRMTTKGLKWDVQDWETGLGGQVSTSNRLEERGKRKGEEEGEGKGEWKVEVEATGTVLFTIELAERLQGGGGG